MLGQEFLALESRETPSAYVGSGAFRFPDGFELHPFGDWNGGLSVADTEDGETWVGAGVGGGPRVAVFTTAIHERNRPDYFADDPNSRQGIVIVVPKPAATVTTTNVGDPKNYHVFLDFEGPFSAVFKSEVVKGVAAEFATLPIYFTDARPAMPPGLYGTCVVGAPTVWDGWNSAGYAPSPNFGNTAAAGYAFDARTVYAAALGTVPYEVTVAAHEIGHGFGLPHKAGTLMNPEALLGSHFDTDELALLGTRVE